MRAIFLLLAVFLPQPLKQILYRRLFRWRIGKGVRIGWSYVDARQVTLGDNVRIGHFNLIRGIKRLSIGEGTYIANFNQMFGASYPDWASELIVGERVNFMSRHFIDVCGTVDIAAGRSSADGTPSSGATRAASWAASPCWNPRRSASAMTSTSGRA